jgi:hypothetical protein
MSFIEHILEHNVVIFDQLSHLSRARMQQFKNLGDVVDGVAENINDDIFILNFSKLVYSCCL